LIIVEGFKKGAVEACCAVSPGVAIDILKMRAAISVASGRWLGER